MGIGLAGTRVMTADQMIKSHIMMLVRGTLLKQKPEYLIKSKKKNHLNNQKTQNHLQLITDKKISKTTAVWSIRFCLR
ncbi:hypothetical protein [Nitrosopumilus sp.]|uniref:hypothetical protein n=1 Tax=Nitrosopumilus sp. TaxID=2024843 RepID=UPI002931B6C6|nr:hypothetical protein [Nitrosopumilus sp.]